MNGFSGFGNSPAKELKDLRGTKEKGKKVDLTVKPNESTKAVEYDPKKGLAEHLDARTPDAPTDIQMENKGDFNKSNLHKDTKISLNKKKSEEPESYGAGHKKIMKDGPKNKVHGAGNTGNWQPHQFKQ